MNKSVLVIGGGISGVVAALELAIEDMEVYVVERSPFIGGHAKELSCKATDKCSKCSVCLIRENFTQVTADPHIHFLTDSEIEEIKGKAGDFVVNIVHKPLSVLSDACIACGMCYNACPSEPKAILLPLADSLPHYFAIDREKCIYAKGCHKCMDVCPVGAIDLSLTPKVSQLNVGYIIVATGFDLFNAQERGLLGYGRYKNVLTGFDLEQIYKEHHSINSDLGIKDPRKIAFIQCVGSRSEEHNYCSRVCCKYAIRFASLIIYEKPEIEITIFYIDLQTAGKGFSEFYEKNKDNIRFIRGIPVEVSGGPSDKLNVKFENILNGKVENEQFDVVVLSTGIVPGSDSLALAEKLGINLSEDGFFEMEGSLDENRTIKKGIFVAGTCTGPKDIPDSIAHAMGTAKDIIEEMQECKQA